MLRRSKTVLFSPDPDGLVGYNFLTKDSFQCAEETLSFLRLFDDWVDERTLDPTALGLDGEEMDAGIRMLVDFNALIRAGTPAASREDEFARSWAWGIPAAMLHFGLLDRSYLSLEQNEAIQLEKLQHEPPPPLYRTHDGHNDRTILPPPPQGDRLFDVMRARRTVREVTREPITLAELSDCLFAGLGITGFTDSVIGPLPLAMTPSGGARNPYEAFVYVNRVDGLAPGIHHYSALDHSLVPVNDRQSVTEVSAMIGGQQWMDDMACVILLCAYLERTMWKYDDPNAYRVVLIEAGHIAQNVMLAATGHRLTACVSGALAHGLISRDCRLDGIGVAPVYAIGLGHPDPARAVTPAAVR